MRWMRDELLFPNQFLVFQVMNRDDSVAGKCGSAQASGRRDYCVFRSMLKTPSFTSRTLRMSWEAIVW